MIHVADFEHDSLGSFHIETSSKKDLDKRVKEISKQARKKKIENVESHWKFRTLGGSPTRRVN